MPNQSPEPTAVGACRSAIAVHAASRRWFSFFRLATFAHFYEDITRSFVWLQFGLFSPAAYHRGSGGYCFTKPKERLTMELDWQTFLPDDFEL